MSPSVCPPLLTTHPVFVLYYCIWYKMQYIVLPLYLYCIFVFCIWYNIPYKVLHCTVDQSQVPTVHLWHLRLQDSSTIIGLMLKVFFCVVHIYMYILFKLFFSSNTSIIWYHQSKHRGIQFSGKCLSEHIFLKHF